MPKVIGPSPHNRWENEVLKAFRQQLPADWVVMPSVGWTLRKDDYVKDGEADFVVLAPGLGLVVIEVKGSKEFKVDNAVSGIAFSMTDLGSHYGSHHPSRQWATCTR